MEFEDFLKWHNINLKLESLPCYVNGFAYFNGREYLVIVNARCSCFQQKETLAHEMIHIFENHFSCPKIYENKCEKEVTDIIYQLRYKFI